MSACGFSVLDVDQRYGRHSLAHANGSPFSEPFRYNSDLHSWITMPTAELLADVALDQVLMQWIEKSALPPLDGGPVDDALARESWITG